MTLRRTAILRKPPDASYASVPLKVAKPPRGPRQRKCATCRTLFVPMTAMGRVCSVGCAIELVTQQKAKQERKEDRARKQAIKLERSEDAKRKKALETRQDHIIALKRAMHKYVRARDEGKPCASCDTPLLKLGRWGGDYDAGHFRSVGSAKHLEFDERNVWGQCKHCNHHQKGNPQEYERRLRILKGDKYVDELLADQEPRKYGIPELQAMTAHYKAELKALQPRESA